MSADPMLGARFREVFHAEPSVELVAQAISSFEATLVTDASAFDRVEWGLDDAALSPSASKGLALFRGRAGCSTCHFGPNLTDEGFHNTGVPGDDPGRAAVTGLPQDWHTFKTPSLRNVALTAPYMHDGSLPNLRSVLEFYDRGGSELAGKDPEMRPLQLEDDEISALLAFLESLTSPVVELDPRLFSGADLREANR